MKNPDEQTARFHLLASWLIFLFVIVTMSACQAYKRPITPPGPDTTRHSQISHPDLDVALNQAK